MLFNLEASCVNLPVEVAHGKMIVEVRKRCFGVHRAVQRVSRLVLDGSLNVLSTLISTAKS